VNSDQNFTACNCNLPLAVCRRSFAFYSVNGLFVGWSSPQQTLFAFSFWHQPLIAVSSRAMSGLCSCPGQRRDGVRRAAPAPDLEQNER
jgi:hypothetical protein